MSTLYELTANTLDGKNICFEEYRGKVLLIVNTASQCGFTPQYAGLEKLYREYSERGFIVLAFPCNQFGGQEPGDAAEIARFCSLTYDASFPIFEKIEVNGENTHPVYRFLKEGKAGLLGTSNIKWNFTKFLVDRSGNAVKRFAPLETPESLRGAIEAVL